MAVALLLALGLAQSPALASPLRVLVAPGDSDSAALQPELESKLLAHGMVAIPREQVLAPLRAQGQATAQWKSADAAMKKGLQAEQDLDLATSRSQLEQARDQLSQLGAEVVDPQDFGALLAALARVQDEQGDVASEQLTLKSWAALPVPPLDERAFPPALVSRAAQARTQPPLAKPIPIAWIWQSGAVDAVLAIQLEGPPGAQAAAILFYRRPSLTPERAAAASLANPSARGAELDRALGSLVVRPHAESLDQQLPKLVHDIAPAPSENALVLGTSFDFPSFYGYVRGGETVFGLGLAVLGRYETQHGPAFGGRLDLIWGGVDTEQGTFTARWTMARGLWRFSVEPGLGVKLRQGVSDLRTDSYTGETINEIDLSRSAVSLVAECGGAIGVQLADFVVLEESASLGVDVLSSDYTINAPFVLRTTFALRF